MSLDKSSKDSMKYESMPLTKTKKSGIRIISEMSNLQIIGYFLGRNKYPVSVMINLLIVGFMAWDKIARPLFF